VNAEHSGGKQRRRNPQQIDRPERGREGGRQRRTRNGTARAARGDEAEQALALFVAEEIDHEAPEYQHHEQIEDAGPYKNTRAACGRSSGAWNATKNIIRLVMKNQ
jgi:hypothetical protein